jgi:UDP-glucose 4-epimerase
VIFGDGSQSRDFTYVTDVVRGNLLAATAPLEGAHVFNIGAGAATSVAALAQAVIDMTGAAVEPEYRAPRPGDVTHSLADTRRARERLGFVAATDLATGLAETASGAMAAKAAD